MMCPTCGQENADDALACTACATPLPRNIQTGHTGAGEPGGATYSPHLSKGIRLQNGSYGVGEVLGQGGFGITYKGGDLGLRRYVALKEFFPQGCRRAGNDVEPVGGLSAADYALIKGKFIEEARTLARFSDPGIVRVFGVFEENNTAYMVMEFLEGMTLSRRISDVGPLEESEVVRIAQAVGSALKVVHEAGLIHRDLKPDNICLTQESGKEGRVVLIDFGTARSFALGKTVQQTTMLTPGYAPLEQYGQHARFGAYTDIYALAATLYHGATGQVPPQATDRAAGVELKAPNQLNPRLSPGLSQALVWALSIKATERPQNVDEFLDALTPRLPVQSVTVTVPQTQVVAPASQAWGATPTLILPVPSSAPTGEEWFHAAGGTQTGPLSLDSMRNLLRMGVISGETLVWREGMAAWITARQSEWASDIPTVQTRPVPRLDADNAPLFQPKPETGFDRTMGSVPAWAWYTIWITVFLVVAGRVGLGVVRYQNGSRDFGTQLAPRVLADPKAKGLTEAKLQLGDATYDETALVNRHDDYNGTVRYDNGDAGTLTLHVKSRDWLYAPETFDLSYAPTNFGPTMSGQILAEITTKLQVSDPKASARRLSLQRQSRTFYTGGFEVFTSDTNKSVPGGTVAVTVESFNGEGAPATWNYTVN